jgi:hypothetical protein
MTQHERMKGSDGRPSPHGVKERSTEEDQAVDGASQLTTPWKASETDKNDLLQMQSILFMCLRSKSRTTQVYRKFQLSYLDHLTLQPFDMDPFDSSQRATERREHIQCN